MRRKTIKAATEKEQKMFMNPVRQRVFRTMKIIGAPITAKGLADAPKMPPASTKHHLTPLESIGLVSPITPKASMASPVSPVSPLNITARPTPKFV